ncbi:hypothetical protein ACOMHN_063449 [Nucella lapillus]
MLCLSPSFNTEQVNLFGTNRNMLCLSPSFNTEQVNLFGTNRNMLCASAPASIRNKSTCLVPTGTCFVPQPQLQYGTSQPVWYQQKHAVPQPQLQYGTSQPVWHQQEHALCLSPSFNTEQVNLFGTNRNMLCASAPASIRNKSTCLAPTGTCFVPQLFNTEQVNLFGTNRNMLCLSPSFNTEQVNLLVPTGTCCASAPASIRNKSTCWYQQKHAVPQPQLQYGTSQPVGTNRNMLCLSPSFNTEQVNLFGTNRNMLCASAPASIRNKSTCLVPTGTCCASAPASIRNKSTCLVPTGTCCASAPASIRNKSTCWYQQEHALCLSFSIRNKSTCLVPTGTCCASAPASIRNKSTCWYQQEHAVPQPQLQYGTSQPVGTNRNMLCLSPSFNTEQVNLLVPTGTCCASAPASIRNKSTCWYQQEHAVPQPQLQYGTSQPVWYQQEHALCLSPSFNTEQVNLFGTNRNMLCLSPSFNTEQVNLFGTNRNMLCLSPSFNTEQVNLLVPTGTCCASAPA